MNLNSKLIHLGVILTIFFQPQDVTDQLIIYFVNEFQPQRKQQDILDFTQFSLAQIIEKKFQMSKILLHKITNFYVTVVYRCLQCNSSIPQTQASTTINPQLLPSRNNIEALVADYEAEKVMNIKFRRYYENCGRETTHFNRNCI